MNFLTLLERLSSMFWGTIRRIVGLFVPWVARARDFPGLSTGVRRALGVVLLVGILVALWWVNVHFDLSPLVLAPRPWLRRFWLPLLALLLYAIIWLGWWLWQLLAPEEEAADFPDIDAAWEEARKALNRSGLDVREAPLFLVLGRPRAAEKTLFDAAQLNLQVAYAPDRGDAPLHVYASREAVFVTCAGASLLGRQAAILAGEGLPSEDGAADGAVGGAAGADLFRTLEPKGRLRDVQAVLARARTQGRSPDQLTDAEQLEVKQLIAQDEAEHARQQVSRPRPLLLKHAAEVAELTARLRHLCRLIVRDRQPYCPANGVLVLVPWAAGDSKEDADQTGAVLQQELAAVRGALEVHCPLFTLVCDLETAPGFAEFLHRFPTEQRQRRVGQRFPLAPDLGAGESLGDAIDRSVQWIWGTLVPTWVYRLFRVEEDNAGYERIVQGNARLYRLLAQARERQPRFAGLLVRGLAAEQEQPWLFGGCYLGATGAAPAEQAFTPGVFRRLIENQNYVSWTEAAQRGEADYRRWTRTGYTGIALAAVVLILLIAGSYFLPRR
jgi:hypothetical protein